MLENGGGWTAPPFPPGHRDRPGDTPVPPARQWRGGARRVRGHAHRHRVGRRQRRAHRGRAARRPAARLHAAALLAAGARDRVRADGARRDGDRAPASEEGGRTRGLGGRDRPLRRARGRAFPRHADAPQSRRSQLRRGDARLGGAARRARGVERRGDRQRALPAAGGGSAARRAGGARGDHGAAVVPGAGGAALARVRRAAAWLHVPGVPRRQRRTHAGVRRQPRAVAAHARAALLAVAGRACRAGAAEGAGAAAGLGGARGGRARARGSRARSAPAGVVVGARHRRRVLEAVRAARRRRGAGGGTPRRRHRRPRAGRARAADAGGAPAVGLGHRLQEPGRRLPSLSRTRPDAAERMVAAWRRYLEIAPANDPDLGNIRLLVAEAEGTLKRAAPAPR